MEPPAFLEGRGQDRARGRHLTAANTLSAFGRINQPSVVDEGLVFQNGYCEFLHYWNE